MVKLTLIWRSLTLREQAIVACKTRCLQLVVTKVWLSPVYVGQSAEQEEPKSQYFPRNECGVFVFWRIGGNMDCRN